MRFMIVNGSLACGLHFLVGVDAGAPLRAWRVRALEPSKGAATQHRDRGHHRAISTDSYATSPRDDDDQRPASVGVRVV